MMTMAASTELETWAGLADYTLTRDAEGGGTDVFWYGGGDARYFVREKKEGWVEVTCSDRFGPEYFIFAGASAVVVERFLFSWFGDTYRNISEMEFIPPMSATDVPLGFRVVNQKFDGVDRYVLIDPADRVIAASSGGRLMAPSRLAPLPILLNATVDEIEESYRSQDGRPLFRVNA